MANVKAIDLTTGEVVDVKLTLALPVMGKIPKADGTSIIFGGNMTLSNLEFRLPNPYFVNIGAVDKSFGAN